MKLAALVTLLLFTGLLVSGVTYFVYEIKGAKLPPDTTEVPYLFYVREEIGVDTGTDIFRLGALRPGTTSYRTLSISDALVSTTGTQHRVSIWVRGEGSEWLLIEPQEATTPVDVKITAVAPADAPLGEYRGKIYVTRLAPAISE